MSSGLEELKKYSVVVVDSGDYETFKDLKPRDATTNPTLIYLAAQKDQYRHLLDRAVAEAKEKEKDLDKQVTHALDNINVAYGVEILKLVPGRVSTEVDARLSFNTQATVAKARELISIYEKHGITRDRVLVKIATTWEGIQAAKILEAEGIHVNMTLLFSLTQAVACAEVGATLISPFVGRITDFFKNREGKDFPPTEDPGVLSVVDIFDYYKTHGHKTEIMAASFRTKEQVLHLAGCDLLTVSPKLLEDIKQCPAADVKQKLCAGSPKPVPKLENLDEKRFRWLLNENEMATNKLSEGIRRFAADLVKLESNLKELISKK